jgi:hypothetical protein
MAGPKNNIAFNIISSHAGNPGLYRMIYRCKPAARFEKLHENNPAEPGIADYRSLLLENNFLFENIYKSIKHNHRVICIRNERSIKWRFFDVPGGDCVFPDLRMDARVLCYTEVRRKESDTEIVDFYAGPEAEHLPAAVKPVVDHVARNGIRSVQFQNPPSNYCFASFRKPGFMERKGISRITFVCIRST